MGRAGPLGAMSLEARKVDGRGDDQGQHADIPHRQHELAEFPFGGQLHRPPLKADKGTVILSPEDDGNVNFLARSFPTPG